MYGTESGWKPIATAPKDGTVVWLRDDKKIYLCMMRWNKRRKQWEGNARSMFGVVKTFWDESFVPIHEWKYI